MTDGPAPAAVSMPSPETAPGTGPRLVGWRDRVVLGVVLAAFASGFGQFGEVAALGGVARTFGHGARTGTLAAQVGLSATILGLGLAVIRLASLGGLPLTALADRFGRRTMLLATVTVGLVATVVAAVSPGYWWFVAIFALGRPFLSSTNALSQVTAAEQTSSADRAKAVALVAAGYGVGAGLTAVIHSLGSSALGFRGIFALAVVPLCLVPLMARWTTEPDRFTRAAATDHPVPVLGAVGPASRRRLVVMVALAFAISFVTGPANTFVFLFAQNVVHLAGPVVAAMVVGAGVTGLAGLLAGRWLSDHLGQRPTGAAGLLGIVGFGALVYAGPPGALVVGYLLAVFAGSVFAPAIGSLLNELFPTSVRASAAGWFLVAGVIGAVCGLIAFGAVAQVDDRFSLATVVTFLPAAAAAALFAAVPERVAASWRTCGRPDERPSARGGGRRGRGRRGRGHWTRRRRVGDHALQPGSGPRGGRRIPRRPRPAPPAPGARISGTRSRRRRTGRRRRCGRPPGVAVDRRRRARGRRPGVGARLLRPRRPVGLAHAQLPPRPRRRRSTRPGRGVRRVARTRLVPGDPVSTHHAVLAVWAAVGILAVTTALVAARSGGRVPGYGALARAATDGPVRRTVVLVAWMWLGWHAFAR